MEMVKMQTSEIIMLVNGIGTIVIGASAVLVSVCALTTSRRYNQLVEKQVNLQADYNRLVQGQVEMQIRESISNARARYEDLVFVHKENLGDIESALSAAKEDFANAYEGACQKYLDGKVDKERFVKSYKDTNELFRIVTDSAFKELYSDTQTNYPATVKVYRAWYQTE